MRRTARSRRRKRWAWGPVLVLHRRRVSMDASGILGQVVWTETRRGDEVLEGQELFRRRRRGRRGADLGERRDREWLGFRMERKREGVGVARRDSGLD